MPELPEVETTRRGIEPHIIEQVIEEVQIREYRLRWPIPTDLPLLMQGQRVNSVGRRGKYLILATATGSLIVHLGMSGSLRIMPVGSPPRKHDHVDFMLASGQMLRFTDPRRFGCVLWTNEPPEQHKLLSQLGPEPLSDDFSGDLLYQLSSKRTGPVKNFIMDSHIVVGVGNIYANEALFQAGIHPIRAAGKVSLQRYQRLAESIKTILGDAINCGGTTLRDFVGGDGKPGYFSQELKVYGRAGTTCRECSETLIGLRIAQRSSVYCKRCQH